MLKFIFVLFLIVASNFIIGQEISTWLYTADNTEKMPLSLGVKVINNEIITNSPTLVKKGNLSNYFFNYLKFSSEGTIIHDSILGTFDSIFVQSPIKTEYNLGTFSHVGALRKPSSMTFEERACVFFANEDYSKIRYHFFPIDTSYFLTIKYANRLDSNLFVFSIGKQQVNNLSDFTTEIILTDSVGNVLKSNEFSSFNRFVFCNSVLKSEGSYYAVFNKVFLDNIYNPTDLIIYKLDSNLVIRDYYMTQDNRWYNSAASLILPNGNLVVAGVYVDSLGQGGDLWQNKYLSCFDSDLNLLWTKVFGRWSLNTLVSKIMLSQDGNIIGCGSGLFPIEKDSAGMHLTGCLFKFTPEGEELWVKNYQGINNDVYGDLNELISLDEFPDGSIVACGNAITFTPYMQRGWLIKVNSAGDLLFNTVTPDTLTNANSDFVLYPNPSSDFIDVKFDKKTLSEYRLIDLKGKIIHTGTQFPISISHLSEGVYFLELNLIHAPKKRLRFIKN